MPAEQHKYKFIAGHVSKSYCYRECSIYLVLICCAPGANDLDRESSAHVPRVVVLAQFLKNLLSQRQAMSNLENAKPSLNNCIWLNRPR
jgi:hypothetical protein